MSLQIIAAQDKLDDNDRKLAKDEGFLLPSKKDAHTLPRVPKLLPFHVQRYGFSHNCVGLVPSRWIRTLQESLRRAYQNLDGDAQRDARQKRTAGTAGYISDKVISNSFYFLPAKDDLEAWTEKMVIPFLPNIEKIIMKRCDMRCCGKAFANATYKLAVANYGYHVCSHAKPMPIPFLQASDVKEHNDKNATTKWLAYAQKKYELLAKTVLMLEPVLGSANE